MRKVSAKTKIRAGKISSHISVWVISVCVLLFLSILIVINNLPQQQQTEIHAASANSLIYGTNLTLNDANDQFLTSAQTRTDMQQMHITTVRMPIRSVGAPSAAEIQAAQNIKAIGAVPLVILKFSQTDPAGAGVQVVQAMNQVFGSSTVYYEFGNERDLAGTDQTAYTNAWNQYVPKIKAAAPNGKFGGPVNYQQNPSYIAYFVQNANPSPDFISWHEYTCGNSDSAQTCVTNISHWATHISNTKSAIQATGKTVPPIFITEWNYDANPPAGDSRNTAQFQQQFVTTGLQELAKDGVTAAYHYVVTGSSTYQLVDPNGALTAAGQAFLQVASTGGGNNTSVTPGSNSTTTPPYVSPSFACVGGVNCVPTTSPTQMVPSGTQPISNPSISFAVPSDLKSLLPSGTGAVCSSSSNKSCSYTDNCKGVANGSTCEKQVNGCGKSSSGNNVYICKNGKWVYSHWVKQGRGECNFCGGSNNSGSKNLWDSILQLFKLLQELLQKLQGNNNSAS
jgi:hypothetical protein